MGRRLYKWNSLTARTACYGSDPAGKVFLEQVLRGIQVTIHTAAALGALVCLLGPVYIADMPAHTASLARLEAVGNRIAFLHLPGELFLNRLHTGVSDESA